MRSLHANGEGGSRCPRRKPLIDRLPEDPRTSRSPGDDGYAVHSFENDDRQNEWQARERAGVWTISGTWDQEGRPVPVRCVATFGDDGRTVTSAWEYSDGAGWQRFWDTRATRAT